MQQTLVFEKAKYDKGVIKHLGRGDGKTRKQTAPDNQEIVKGIKVYLDS